MVNSSMLRSKHEDDFRFWAKCPKCCKTGLGVVMGDYYSCAYTRKQWARSPKCVNCDTDMQFIYEVMYDED